MNFAVQCTSDKPALKYTTTSSNSSATSRHTGLAWIDCHRRRTSHCKQDAACRNKERDAVVLGLVCLLVHKSSPDHHGDHLGTFSQSLDREAHILQCFILAECGHNIRTCMNTIIILARWIGWCLSSRPVSVSGARAPQCMVREGKRCAPGGEGIMMQYIIKW